MTDFSIKIKNFEIKETNESIGMAGFHVLVDGTPSPEELLEIGERVVSIAKRRIGEKK